VEKAAWCIQDQHTGTEPQRPKTGALSKVTVVVSPYKSELSCLRQQIQNWQHCPIVHSVRLNRFNGDKSFDQAWVESVSISGGPPVIIDHLHNKLSHRFLPRDVMTNAVFSVDVDTFYSCEALRVALAIWQRNPRSAVGFHPRHLVSGIVRELWDTGYFEPYNRNMLLVTKGALQHIDTFSSFFGARYATLRDSVDAAITGEDFLMGFVQAIEADSDVQSVCLSDADACYAKTCHRKVGSLGYRTSMRRKSILSSIFRALGEPLTNQTGVRAMHFARDYRDGVCHSLEKWPANTGPCTASKSINMSLAPE
jgi:hypothetical protein